MITNYPLKHVAVSSGSIDDVLGFIEETISQGARRYCIPLNLSKYVMAKSDEKLREVINNADLVVADGVPIVHLGARVGISGVQRITGIELAERIITVAGEKGWSIFFLGAKQESLEKTIINIRSKVKDIPIAGKHHGYFKEPVTEGIIDQINNSGAQVLLLGMGLPQKEYFIADYLKYLNVRFVLTVGGAFDIWSGAKKRSPRMIQRLGLEWVYRSLYDMSRARLIARYGLIFLKDYLSSRK